MKRLILLPLIMFSLILTTAQAQTQLVSKIDKRSYAMGAQTGKALRSNGVDINPQVFAEGVSDAYQGRKLKLSQQQIKQTLVAFQKAAVDKFRAKMKKTAAVNEKASKAFLQTNRNKPGVVTTKSGLQYKIIKKGQGAHPSVNSIVTVNYEGKLLDGKVFDSSYKRGKPATFPVRGVIPGWKEALQKMRSGATWELYIPARLAYGKTGASGVIGPDEMLIFKVHLISIKK